MWIAADTRDKECRHVELEPTAASIVREGCAHCARLDLPLELGDQLFMPIGLPVHGVLEPLDEPLQMRDTGFEQGDTIILWIDDSASVRCARARRRTANLTDSCEQSLTLAHDHRLHDRLSGALRGG